MKASDVPESVILEVIRNRKYRDLGAGVWEMCAALPSFHEKVIRAKLKAMRRRGIIDGCICGCRGDFLPGKKFPESERKP